MTGKTASIAKITRPRLPDVLPRKRLFRLLDQGRCPVTWIAGPAGSGKTTLVAGYLEQRKIRSLWYQVDEGDADLAGFFYYLGLAAKQAAPRHRTPLPLLTSEYLMGLPVFTRRYFENLFRRMKPPFVLVFDNYQEAPDNAGLHEIMRDALSVVPDRMRVIIISRSDPPPQLARMQAGRKMEIIGWEHIRFTLEESKKLIAAGGKQAPSKGLARELHRQTDGWAAGIVLMSRAMAAKGPDAGSSGTRTLTEIFDYFAGELFDKTEAETKDFLLKSSFLPDMTAQTAAKLTGVNHADRILSHLNRHHIFTTSTRESVYQYHPLFREFLMTRARETFSKAGLADIQREAALILRDNGQLEEAAALFRAAGDRELFVRLILEHAPVLVSQGRLQTLSGWLGSVAEPVFRSIPWLYFWQGVCRLQVDPTEGRADFEKAYSAFRMQGDHPGILFSCSGIMDSFAYEWNDFTPLDHWINVVDEYLESGSPFPSPDLEARVTVSMAAALTLRQPHHGDIEKWHDREMALLRECSDPYLCIFGHAFASVYYAWTGDMNTVRLLKNEVRTIKDMSRTFPLAVITWKWIDVCMDLWGLSTKAAHKGLEETMELVEQTGIHTWDHILYALGVYCSLVEGDFKSCNASLKRMEETLQPSRLHGQCQYYYLLAWRHLLEGNVNQASRYATESLELAEKTGYVFPIILSLLETANVKCEEKLSSSADEYLRRAEELSDRSRSPLLRYSCLLTRARLSFQQEDGKGGLAFLTEALKLGQERGYVSPPWWWQPVVMGELLSRALAAGIEVNYVRRMITLYKIVPNSVQMHLEHWPRPLKVQTLGAFEIEKNGKPVLFPGKVQQRPLEMLKALIAFGGSDVSDEKIMEALWPEAEGDVAFQSFETTLHRLRKVLGVENALQRRENRVSLDSRYCWVDAISFEHLCGQAERDSKAKSAEPGELALKAIAMYRGHFLTGERERPWLITARERLKSRFLRMISRVGRGYELSGEPNSAIECYQKALDIDNLAEEFYQGLMTCYGRLGRRAEAIAVYRQCRTMLRTDLNIEPSSKTEEIYREISGSE